MSAVGWMKNFRSVYSGDMSLKNLKILTQIHRKTLSFVSSQFNFLNSSKPTWDLLSSFKQYRIHLFCEIWIFFSSLLLSEGYHAEQA